jgi:hypothetical protein
VKPVTSRLPPKIWSHEAPDWLHEHGLDLEEFPPSAENILDADAIERMTGVRPHYLGTYEDFDGESREWQRYAAVRDGTTLPKFDRRVPIALIYTEYPRFLRGTLSSMGTPIISITRHGRT